MAKQKVKLSEIPYGAEINIGGFSYVFAGFEKRKTMFGNQEHFVFKCEKPKQEKVFERYKFNSVLINKIGNNEFEW